MAWKAFLRAPVLPHVMRLNIFFLFCMNCGSAQAQVTKLTEGGARDGHPRHQVVVLDNGDIILLARHLLVNLGFWIFIFSDFGFSRFCFFAKYVGEICW